MRLVMGDATIHGVLNSYWFHKPAGESYSHFDGSLALLVSRSRCQVWRRQMVLGPTPEYAIAASGEMALPMHLNAIELRQVPV